MSIMCSYQNCLCVKYPCSSTAFFCLPSDSRRSIWIKNSGNKALQNIGLKAHRYFCENHFRKCDIRAQFNRKILRKHAVPIAFSDSTADEIQHTSKLSLSVVNSYTNSNSNLVIDKLYVNADVIEGDDTDIQDETNENTNSAYKEDTDNSSTIIDFYLQQPCEADESYEENSPKEINEQEDIDYILYEESDSHRPDSSTVDLQYITEEVKSTAEIPVNSPQSIETPLQAPTSCQTVNDYEEDRHFALSLVGYFQRLPKDKKAIAKLKILHYLTDLDIGLVSNL